jgi:hypothetical protein
MFDSWVLEIKRIKEGWDERGIYSLYLDEEHAKITMLKC